VSTLPRRLRLSMPIIVVSVTRKVLKPFTFSNGVTVPSGTYLAVHMYATHHDGAFYERPEEFDGFRFVEEKKTGGDDTRKSVIKPPQTMYATSKTWLAFGHGRHAWCVFLFRFPPHVDFERFSPVRGGSSPRWNSRCSWLT